MLHIQQIGRVKAKSNNLIVRFNKGWVVEDKISNSTTQPLDIYKLSKSFTDYKALASSLCKNF